MGELITDVKTLSDLPTKETHFVPETTINTHDNHNGPITSSMEMAPKEEHSGDHVFQITVILPHQPYEIQVTVSTQEQVQDLRQSIIELPVTFQYSCFHLEHDGIRVNDFAELSEIKGLKAGSSIRLVEDPYSEKDARMHVIRVREIIGAVGDRFDTIYGISAGASLHDTILPWKEPEANSTSNEHPTTPKTPGIINALTDYDFHAPVSMCRLLPSAQFPSSKTVKSIGASPWNPPPPYLRQKGHLLYLQLTTNEGEQHQITSHVSGFFVNRSSNSKFDPYPRLPPKDATAHSLFTLIGMLSPSFTTTFHATLEFNNSRDPLTNFQFTSAIPASPWRVDKSTITLSAHQPDLTRSQETYLMSGIENADTLRDWNEEIQSTKELPRESVQEKVFRERLMAKVSAEFTEAAARGAVMVARGEVTPLNPTEGKEAQIFVYNNIFFSFGADGVGTFTSEGGNAAARVAVKKDVNGVRAVNQVDIPGLSTPATITVDYLGKRIVAQSIVPGIFKQREPDEYSVDYGGVEGREIVADNEAFVPAFSKVSKALRIKRHPVWDKEGKKHVLEGSIETKGLLGTDGRKYILDLYRLTPLDIDWVEEYWSDSDESGKDSQHNYPHRMTVLRLELIEAYWRVKMNDFVKEEVAKRKNALSNGTEANSDHTPRDEVNEPQPHMTNGALPERHDETQFAALHGRLDDPKFWLAFNPDVFCGQTPQTDEEKKEWAEDEREVRSICAHLHQKVLPEMIHDLREGEVGFPMDGQSLSELMHKRGINIRYLGKLAILASDQGERLQALRALVTQEMIARSFKRLANAHLKELPIGFAASCTAHLLNCLLGVGLNRAPKPQLDEDLLFLYRDTNCTFTKVTTASMKSDIEAQVYIHYRYTLEQDWMSKIRHVQLLREISLKLGLQLVAKEYDFSANITKSVEKLSLATNGVLSEVAGNQNLNGHVNGANAKKKRRNAENRSPVSVNGSHSTSPPITFTADDIANLVPIIEDACAKSPIAQEALEAGRVSLLQNRKELGQELLLESLSLHEQIYGVLHPEVGKVYHQLAMLYYQLDEKTAAVELAHKAVIISERTLGIDSSETILCYLNLALFEHGNGNTLVALSCMRHALELWKLIYGPKHPDSITTINNAAVMLQHLKLYSESRKWFELSLAISEDVSGKTSVNTATLSFQLAQALALDHDAKGAVQRMREACSIFRTKLGPDDRNTKEAETWLEQLTQNAVSIARHAKDLQAKRIRKVLLAPKVTLGTRPQPQVGQAPTGLMVNGRDSQGGGILDPRSIDELLKFIEGGSEAAKKPSKKRSTPRNRQR